MAARRKQPKPTKPAPKKERKRTAPDWTPLFLAALAETGNITAAARASGVNRDTFYQRRDADPDFAAAAAQALETATDSLEMEARRRAHDGLPRLKFHQGELICTPDGKPYVEREYSDTLLIFLLKAHRPEKYRENVRHEHTGPGGGPIQFIEVGRSDAPADRGSDEP